MASCGVRDGELLISNGLVWTFENGAHQLVQHGAVFVVGDTISEIGDSDALVARHPACRNIDAKGKLIMPGFICAHGHFYGMYARGMALKDEAPSTFLEVLQRLWWRLDKALDAESTYLSAMVFYIAAIKAGTTCIMDHHASPNCIENSLDFIANAALRSGVRSSLCYEVTDRNGDEGAAKGIAENARFITRCLTNPHPLLAASFGIHASFTVSDKTLASCVEALKSTHASTVGFHVHVAEGQHDEDQCVATHGKRVVHRLRDAGILGANTIVGHGVFLDEDEMDILKATSTTLVTNPESNMNNAVGIPNILKMMGKGILVGLGTDGMTYDMLQEYKTNYLIHKFNTRDPRVAGQETFQLLMENNSKIASKFFSKPVGVLKPGAFADIILVDYHPPTPMTMGNMPWHMQFGMSSSDVDTTIVGGKVLMMNKTLTDAALEPETLTRSNAAAPAVWRAF